MGFGWVWFGVGGFAVLFVLGSVFVWFRFDSVVRLFCGFWFGLVLGVCGFVCFWLSFLVLGVVVYFVLWFILEVLFRLGLGLVLVLLFVFVGVCLWVWFVLG